MNRNLHLPLLDNSLEEIARESVSSAPDKDAVFQNRRSLSLLECFFSVHIKAVWRGHKLYSDRRNSKYRWLIDLASEGMFFQTFNEGKMSLDRFPISQIFDRKWTNIMQRKYSQLR